MFNATVSPHLREMHFQELVNVHAGSFGCQLFGTHALGLAALEELYHQQAVEYLKQV